MRRRFIPLLEFLGLVLVFIALAYVVGAPETDARPGLFSPQRSSGRENPPGLADWDRALRLPTQSDRIANYTMDVHLDTATNVISGWEILEWTNTTGRPQSQFPFHLYHNAWKNNRSTYAKESGYSMEGRFMREKDYGYTNVKRVVWLDEKREVDITSGGRFLDPEYENPDDQTVYQISIPKPIRNGQVFKVRIEFETKQPLPVSRTGVIRNYHFVAQWFPKIGVWWNGAWNCYPFHSTTEFFADFGVYDVTLTVPTGYVVGATGGNPRWNRVNENGTSTFNFFQEDVHDFAWVTSPELVRTVRTFRHNQIDTECSPNRHHDLKEVTVILLSQPHHGNLIDRYFDAAFKGLRFYGEWYGEYPYATLTVVDPANDSRSGGMEYPTIFTGGASMFSPKEQSSPEGVTVHEFGHQFWYGLVANNEFEEAWLDEGFNTYSTARTLEAGWPPFKAVETYLGGIPYVFDVVDLRRFTTGNLDVRMQGTNDVMARRGWEYYQSYGLNSYTKPALSLAMLERIVGEPVMYRIMRTYHHRYRFKHPTSRDFINVVNEVTGQNMQWFFDNTWYSSNLFDYKIESITNREVPKPSGVFSGPDGVPLKADTASVPRYECTVVVKREGGAIAPVDVLITFDNGEQRRESWDGQYRWKAFIYRTNSPVASAIVDPDEKILLDVDYTNNSKVIRGPDGRSLAARKIASKWMIWFQVGLDCSTYLH
jgi:hypothetical protein